VQAFNSGEIEFVADNCISSAYPDTQYASRRRLCANFHWSIVGKERWSFQGQQALGHDTGSTSCFYLISMRSTSASNSAVGVKVVIEGPRRRCATHPDIGNCHLRVAFGFDGSLGLPSRMALRRAATIVLFDNACIISFFSSHF